MAIELPEDVQWYIWRIYGREYVMAELFNNYEFVWHKPSDRLKSLVRCDQGAIQHGHHELTDMIEDHNMWLYHDCVSSKCENCSQYGFPCSNLAMYGFQNPHLNCLFKSNF